MHFFLNSARNKWYSIYENFHLTDLEKISGLQRCAKWILISYLVLVWNLVWNLKWILLNEFEILRFKKVRNIHQFRNWNLEGPKILEFFRHKESANLVQNFFTFWKQWKELFEQLRLNPGWFPTKSLCLLHTISCVVETFQNKVELREVNVFF